MASKKFVMSYASMIDFLKTCGNTNWIYTLEDLFYLFTCIEKEYKANQLVLHTF